MSSFKEKVLEIVKMIPRGDVMTYGEVARRVGHPKASRAVGTILAHNTDICVPCHRVVRGDGTIGAYNGLRGNKRQLLEKEGVLIKKGKVIKTIQ